LARIVFLIFASTGNRVRSSDSLDRQSVARSNDRMAEMAQAVEGCKCEIFLDPTAERIKPIAWWIGSRVTVISVSIFQSMAAKFFLPVYDEDEW
jgi:hypothetical protein